MPRMDPIEDMGIRDQALINAVSSLERLERRLGDNEIFKVFWHYSHLWLVSQSP